MAFNALSLIPSLVGLGTKIGTAIPGLKKQPKANTAREVARGATTAFGGAVGAAQAGHGASRGLALREGLRQATQAVGKVSAQTRLAAQQDVATNTAQEGARRQRIAEFGTDLAKGLGDMAALGIQAKSEGEAPDEEFLSADEQALAETPGTGVADKAAAPDDSAGLGDLEQEQLALEDAEQQQLIGDAGQQLDDFRSQREAAGIGEGAGPQAAFQVDPTTKLIESAPPRVQPEIEQALADKLHMKELALSEMERLGLSFETHLPRLNRRLNLRAGQSTQNPFGVGLDLDVADTE